MLLEEQLASIQQYKGKRGTIFKDPPALRILHKELPYAKDASAWLGYRHGQDFRRRALELGLDFKLYEYSTQRRQAPQEEWDSKQWLEWYMEQTSAADRGLKVTIASGKPQVKLVGLSDIHWGCNDCDVARLARLIEWIRTTEEEVRWFLGGDNVDLATATSPGTGLMKQTLPADVAIDTLALMLAPVIEKGLFVLEGNHEQRLARTLKIELSPAKMLARQLALPFAGYEQFVRYELLYQGKELSYTGYHHHGTGTGQTKGSVLNTALRIAQNNTADFVTMGHRHQALSDTLTERYMAEDGTIQVGKTPVICLGTFQKSKHGSYAVDKALAPSVLGATGIILDCTEKQVREWR